MDRLSRDQDDIAGLFKHMAFGGVRVVTLSGGDVTHLNKVLDRIIDEHGLIVSGWSADWDPALRAALTRAPTWGYPVYWAARGEPSKIATDLIRQRAGRTIRIDSADTKAWNAW